MKKFLRLSGEFNRKDFILSFFGILFTFLIVDGLFVTYNSYLNMYINIFILGIIYTIVTLLFVFCVVYAFVSIVKRLRDLKINSWFSILIIIPFVNLFFIAALCFAEGK